MEGSLRKRWGNSRNESSELIEGTEQTEICSKGLRDNACQYRFIRDLKVGLPAVESNQRYNLRSDN
jgi:hypothetical protein